jgi:hypothetical protein
MWEWIEWLLNAVANRNDEVKWGGSGVQSQQESGRFAKVGVISELFLHRWCSSDWSCWLTGWNRVRLTNDMKLSSHWIFENMWHYWRIWYWRTNSFHNFSLYSFSISTKRMIEWAFSRLNWSIYFVKELTQNQMSIMVIHMFLKGCWIMGEGKWLDAAISWRIDVKSQGFWLLVDQMIKRDEGWLEKERRDERADSGEYECWGRRCWVRWYLEELIINLKGYACRLTR